MKPRMLLLSLFCVIVAACRQPKKSDAEYASRAEDLEEFNAFFERFTTDSLFQIKRTKFPFRMLWADDDGYTVHEIEKADWTHSTFRYEDGYATRQVDPYTQEIRIYGDTVKLEQRGVDNGIHIDYEFVKEKGDWFLVLGRDLSN